MIADLARSGMAVQNAISARAAPVIWAICNWSSSAETTAGFLQEKDDVIILELQREVQAICSQTLPILTVSVVCLLRYETEPLRQSMNITLIVCRLIVVTIQVWESDFSLRKSSIWRLIAKAPRRTRILARGIGRTGRAAPELRGWGGARGTERSP